MTQRRAQPSDRFGVCAGPGGTMTPSQQGPASAPRSAATLPDRRSPGPARGPVIGVAGDVAKARWGIWDQRAAVLPLTYLQALGRAGAIPVILPPDTWPAEDVVARIDALVLTGGPDVDPRLYGEPRAARTDPPDIERDGFELRLLAAALKRDLPVLAICRGMQILNTVCGGSLLQHLPDVVGHDGHLAKPGTFGSMAVHITESSQLAGVLGATVRASCHHHQAVNRLGAGLDAVAWSADGTVEAVEHQEHAFVVGVQWHPEEHEDIRLFDALVAAT